MAHPMVKVNCNLDFHKASAVTFGDDGAFPESPRLRQLALVGGALYIYTSINGILTWYPLTTPKLSYVHTQGVTSNTWVINHNLGTQDIIYFIYDDSNNMLINNASNLTENTLTITFTEPVIGRAIVFSANDSLASSANHGFSPNWIVTKSSMTATVNSRIFADTTLGSFTITLPENPNINESIFFADYAHVCGINNLIISSGTNKMAGISGETFVLDRNGASVEIIYINDEKGWVPVL